LPIAAGQHIQLALLAFRLIVAIALLPFALDWRSPLLASLRPAALTALIALPLLLVAIDGPALWQASASRIRRVLSVIAVATASLLTTLWHELAFRHRRMQVMASDPAQLERLGGHFIIGYRDPAELRALIDRRAIGGVFIATRNIEGRSPADIRPEIDGWQDTRRRQGLPPLWIATDQEGGAVSRLSPPLPRQPPIASIVVADQSARAQAAYEYGLAQGRGLASLSVNLNFAPVVDINRDLVNPNDRYTRIRERAISERSRHRRRGGEALLPRPSRGRRALHAQAFPRARSGLRGHPFRSRPSAAPDRRARAQRLGSVSRPDGRRRLHHAEPRPPDGGRSRARDVVVATRHFRAVAGRLGGGTACS
jgi:hypothetical protein